MNTSSNHRADRSQIGLKGIAFSAILLFSFVLFYSTIKIHLNSANNLHRDDRTSKLDLMNHEVSGAGESLNSVAIMSPASPLTHDKWFETVISKARSRLDRTTDTIESKTSFRGNNLNSLDNHNAVGASQNYDNSANLSRKSVSGVNIHAVTYASHGGRLVTMTQKKTVIIIYHIANRYLI
jgi:hypothetical protein